MATKMSLTDIDAQIEKLRERRKTLIAKSADRFARAATKSGLAEMEVADEEVDRIFASILGWLGEPAGALADLNQALTRDPLSVHALTNRGLAYFNNGDTSRALADFDAAIRLSPNDSGLYGFRAAARRQAGDDTGAKADQAKMTELMFEQAQ